MVREEEFHSPGDEPVGSPKEESHEHGNEHHGPRRIQDFFLGGPIHTVVQLLEEVFGLLLERGDQGIPED